MNIKQSTIDKKFKQILYWDDQCKFTSFCKRHFKIREFYFDDIFGVDGKTQKNIPYLRANGTMTWGEAFKVVKAWNDGTEIAKPHYLTKEEIQMKQYIECYYR